MNGSADLTTPGGSIKLYRRAVLGGLKAQLKCPGALKRNSAQHAARVHRYAGEHAGDKSVRGCAVTLITAGILTVVPVAPCLARAVDHTLFFREQDLYLGKALGYDVITLEGCDVTREVGKPRLPVLPVTLALPAGARVTRLEVVSAHSSELLGRFYALPAQVPRILPIPNVHMPAPPFVPPDPSVYESPEPYPADLARILSVGAFGDAVVVGLAVHPVQFLPESQKLRMFLNIQLRVHYEQNEQARSAEGCAEAAAALRAISANPAAVLTARRSVEPRERLLDPADYEYVVITNNQLEPAFAPLCEWKTRKGVPATTVLVSWITGNYTGPDDPARIRNFIADAYESWGTTWVLLGGDTSIVPARTAYAMTSEAGLMPDEDEIRCDLYFSDLDGSWDEDADGIYGEIDDLVDLYPDVFVGRASVETADEAQALVTKLVAHERTPEPDYACNMLMAAEILWDDPDPYTDSGIALNLIDREYVPPRFDPITKLYESLGNESPESVIEAINDGQNMILHSGHAWFNCMGCGDGYLMLSHVDELTNAPETSVLYSIGCWPAAFDYDCIGERFIGNPDGGCVAFIGNSRYGWASPGNPGYGYSERFMQAFYRVLLREGVGRLGTALSAAKASFVPFSQGENVYRWHQYQVNLLGDPEARAWTDLPGELHVSHPDSLVAGPLVFDVAVWSAEGPVQGALVCVANGSDIYSRGLTGSQGTIALEIDPGVPDSLDITVTGQNRHPYEARIPVRMAGAFLSPAACTVDDSSHGNGDGIAGPKEVVDLLISLRNSGSRAATGVTAVMSTEDGYVTVLDSVSSFGDVGAGATAVGAPAFRASIGKDCVDSHVALLELSITSTGSRRAWIGIVPLTIGAPRLSAGGYSVDDFDGGDGDGLPEPGEFVSFMVEVVNEGLAGAASPIFTLESLDPYVVVTSGEASAGDVLPGDGTQAVFELGVAHSCPVPHFPELVLTTATADSFASSDTLVVAVGEHGFAIDFETGAAGWTHGGTGDLWTMTTNRSNSGTTSWYCGSEQTWTYADSMDCCLTSPPFVLGVDAELELWCWYDVAIYGVDGFFVELVSGGEPVDTLDFVGSGGALGTLGGMGNDWLSYGYRLGGDPGDTVQVRFRFVSDAEDVAEGVYIDDVSVSSAIGSTGTSVAEDEEPQIGSSVRLLQNHPNPFLGETAIQYALSEPGHAVVAIYSIQGRLVRTLVDGARGPGEHVAVWDGKDDTGEDVAAGVYMYRLLLGRHEQARKMILLR